MKKNHILMSFMICFLLNGLLQAADCYVDANYQGTYTNATEQHPCSTIDCCNGYTSNSEENDKIILKAGEHTVNSFTLGRRQLVGESMRSTIVYSTHNSCNFSSEYSAEHMFIVEYGAEISNITFTHHPDGFSGGCSAIFINETNDENIPLIRNNIFQDVGSNSTIIVRPYMDVNIRNNVFYNSTEIDIVGYNNLDEIYIMNNFFGDMNNNDALAVQINSYQNAGTDNIIHVHNNLLKNSTLNDIGIDQVSYNAQVFGSTAGENPVLYYQFQEDNNELGWVSDNVLEYYFFAIDPANSLLFDSGHPDSEFNDLDGSRGDIGLFGGEFTWATYGPGPAITSFSVDPIVVPIDGTIQVNARAITE